MVIVDMRGTATGIADQKNAIMQAPRMGIGEIGIGTFHPRRDIVGHEQIENAINAVCRNAAPLHPANRIGYVIGAGRPVKPRKRQKYRSTHRRPLFTRSDKRLFGSGDKRGAAADIMVVIVMSCHATIIGCEAASRKAHFQPRKARKFHRCAAANRQTPITDSTTSAIPPWPMTSDAAMRPIPSAPSTPMA